MVLLALKTRKVIGAFRSVYCESLRVVYCWSDRSNRLTDGRPITPRLLEPSEGFLMFFVVVVVLFFFFWGGGENFLLIECCRLRYATANSKIS